MSLFSRGRLKNKEIEVYNIFILTRNTSDSTKAGDWWEYKGLLSPIKIPKSNGDPTLIYKFPYLAQIRGGIESDGGSRITSSGICYNKTGNPTINDSVFMVQPDYQFDVEIGRLTPSCKYYAKIFLTNSEGTGYSNEIQFTTPSANYGTLTDVDGNTYKTVKIGIQTWMAENLRVTKLNNNTPINYVKEDTSWEKADFPAYCWYGNAISFRGTYGALYNNYVIMTNKICPAGWHVPNNAEWNELIDYLGGYSKSGIRLITSEDGFWTDSDTKGTDAVGFSALPGGFRDYDGDFRGKGSLAIFTDDDNYFIAKEINSYGASSFTKENNSEKVGFSIRCVKD